MSKRFDLREYQQGVLSRIQAQEAGGGDQALTLGVQIGSKNWLVNMADISEVLSLPPLTPVPLTKDWYLGVANVRGNLYGIIDIGLFFGAAVTVPDAQSRVLLIGQKFAFNAGLLVGRVLGMRNTKSWKKLIHEDLVEYQDEEGQMWRELSIDNLLQDTGFLQIAA